MPQLHAFIARDRCANPVAVLARATELLRDQGLDRLHNRKLRSFAEVAFQ